MNDSLKLDYLINNATVIDGTGAASYVGSIGISGDKMIIGNTEGLEASQVIEGRGLLLTPGFIDTHASTGFGYFFPHAADHKLYQGITTEIFGNCGTSPGPIGFRLEQKMEEIASDLGFNFNWKSLGNYFNRLEEIGIQFNVASLTGHSTLRAGSLADWNSVTPHEKIEMRQAMRLSMKDGALGLSTGLIYAPGCFADTQEIVELAHEAAKAGGIYASHMRDERDKLEEAIEETLQIGREAGINVLVSHLKSAEKQNFGKIPKIIKRLEEFNKEGRVKAKIDIYPYTAVSTKLRAFVPKELLSEGIEKIPDKLSESIWETKIADYIKEKGYDLSKMLFISNAHPEWEGKYISEIAMAETWSEAKTVTEILKNDPDVWIIYFCIDEADMDYAICWPNAMICSDSWSHPINAPKKIGIPHPRSYGAFTQYLYDYVKKKKLLRIEEAIRKITSLPADYFNLQQRGKIEDGYYADLVLIDFEQLQPKATYTNPMQLSEGIVHLWINGKLIISEGAINDEKPGRVLRNVASIN